MDDNEKYELELVPVGTTGWNAILSSNMEKIGANVHTYLVGIAGVAFSQYEAGFVGKNGKIFKARADIVRMPCIGLAIEAGSADAEIRFQRAGLMTNGSWTWTPGKPVWLHPTTRGALTQTKPSFPQYIGMAKSATELFIDLQFPWEWTYGSTTTTTSSSSSTTSTTASSSSTTTTTAP